MGTPLYLLVLVVLSVLHPVHPSSCPDAFLEYLNQYVQWGNFVETSSPQECADKCRELSPSTCYGYGILDGTDCYLVTYVHTGSQVHWSTSWDRYQRQFGICDGTTTTTTTASCQETYIAYQNQYVEGGTFVSTSDCAEACVQSSSTCYGYGIFQGTDCYLVTYAHNGGQVHWNPSWDRWQRSSFNC